MTDVASRPDEAIDLTNETVGDYPLPPGLLQQLRPGSMATAAESVESADTDDPDRDPMPYEDIIESICGIADDSQPVEQYDGTLGASKDFVNTHQRPVGQIQWNSDLASHYTNPGNVSGARWCTGTLISDNLFLTAGHCFDPDINGWTFPRVNGTSDPISPTAAARRMHINFNYQHDADGNLRDEVEFGVEELVEHRLGGLDVAIMRLAGHPGSRFGIGGMAPHDASIGDMLTIIGHPAGVPKRVEAGPTTSFGGDRIHYNDIDTLGGNSGSAIWHNKTGRIVGVHTNGGCNEHGTGSNKGYRVERIREESPTIKRLDHTVFPLDQGIYRVKQKSSGRYLDAHGNSNNDFSVVTRDSQANDTQRWRFTPVGMVGTLTQVSSGRYLDAHQNQTADFSVVTRTAQNNDTQRWVLLPVAGQLSTYTVQQLSSRRFMDAWVAGNDQSVVTRTAQNNETQQWKFAETVDDGVFTVRQVVNGLFVDAHEVPGHDYSVVTRNAQNNNTQRWSFTQTAGVYEVQQLVNDRFVAAHQNSSNDYSVVTRPRQANQTQLWVLIHLGGTTYHVRQLSSGRYLDAHQNQANDYSVVTRPKQGNDTQRWIIE